MSIRVIILSVFLIATTARAKASNDSLPGKSYRVSINLSVPVDEFSETHFLGAGVSYAWSNNRFGLLSKAPGKLLGFTADAGVDYFFGKKITESGIDFRFKNYWNLHAFGGVIFNEGTNINVRVLTGPTLGIYYGETEFGYGAMLDASYYITEKISLGPMLRFFKNKAANAQWGLGVGAGWGL